MFSLFSIFLFFISSSLHFQVAISACQPPRPPNGSYFLSCGTEVGSICQAKCLLTNQIITQTCKSDNQWSISNWTCSASTGCARALQAPINGYIYGGCVPTNGTICIFDCYRGYTLSGQSRISCVSGQWNATEPICIKATTIATITTAATFNMQSYTPCPALAAPYGGYVYGNCYQWSTFGSVCNFVCSSGWALRGSSSRMCQTNGTWTGIQPTCTFEATGITNRPTDQPTYTGYTGQWSKVSQTDHHWQSTTQPGSYSEMRPFTSPGIPMSTQSGKHPDTHSNSSHVTFPGTQQGTRPANQTSNSTKTVRCSKLSAPKNGKIRGQCNPGIFGQLCNFSCNSGYYLVGNSASVTCLATGKWSTTSPTCSRIRYLLIRTFSW